MAPVEPNKEMDETIENRKKRLSNASVVGSAGVAPLIASAWLVGEIERTLKELSEQYE